MPERAGAKPIQDLLERLARVEELGELIRVGQPVDCQEEMSAISYLVAKQQPSPAVLFERSSGFENSPYGARHLRSDPGRAARRLPGGDERDQLPGRQTATLAGGPVRALERLREQPLRRPAPEIGSGSGSPSTARRR